MSKADAYRNAYDCRSMSPAAVRVEACRLSQNPNVALMVKEIDQRIETELVQLAAYDRQKAFEDASKDRDLAHQQKQAGAAVSATKLKAQIAGHLDDRTQEDSSLQALAQLIEQVRAHGGDMPRGSLTIEQDGSGDGRGDRYVVDTTTNPMKPSDE
jgi:phage terminase small subunit